MGPKVNRLIDPILAFWSPRQGLHHLSILEVAALLIVGVHSLSGLQRHQPEAPARTPKKGSLLPKANTVTITVAVDATITINAFATCMT